MATTRTNKVEVEITAIDEATPKIERLEKKIDGLESDEARIIVSAQTERLEQQLNQAKSKIDGLEGDELSVQARLVGNLETELEQAQTLFAQLDGQTGKVTLVADADDALGDLDRVQAKVRDLDGETVRIGVEGGDGVGGLAAAGKAALGAAGVAAITDQLLAASDLTLQVETLARLTGTTHEEASKTAALWQAQGFEVADLIGLLTQVNDALAGTPELKKQLGVTGAKDLIDQLVLSVEGLADLDPFEKATLSTQLLGEEGVIQVGKIEAAYGDLRTAIEATPPVTQAADVERMQELSRQSGYVRNNMQIARQEAANIAVPGLEQTLATGDINRGIFTSSVAGARSVWRRVFGGDGGSSGSDLIRDAVLSAGAGAATEPQVDLGGQRGATRAARTNVTIINPPGTPAATVDLTRLYDERNGNRS